MSEAELNSWAGAFCQCGNSKHVHKWPMPRPKWFSSGKSTDEPVTQKLIFSSTFKLRPQPKPGTPEYARRLELAQFKAKIVGATVEERDGCIWFVYPDRRASVSPNEND